MPISFHTNVQSRVEMESRPTTTVTAAYVTLPTPLRGFHIFCTSLTLVSFAFYHHQVSLEPSTANARGAAEGFPAYRAGCTADSFGGSPLAPLRGFLDFSGQQALRMCHESAARAGKQYGQSEAISRILWVGGMTAESYDKGKDGEDREPGSEGGAI
jgi:hypothetical protein